MERRTANKIDLVKLGIYLLKHCWVIILCAAIGFGGMYWNAVRNRVTTYTASGTMYVKNANPNMTNYQYTSTSDLASAVRLIDNYLQLVKSNSVIDLVAERLCADYPGLTNSYIAGTISMASVQETSYMRVSCTTRDPELSAAICNAVLDVAPKELTKLAGGDIEKVDAAKVPSSPNPFSPTRTALKGALIGGAAAAAVLAALFLLNRKVMDAQELTESYTPPVLSSIQRAKQDNDDPSVFMLNEQSAMELVESYAKLRMNLLYTLVDKDKHSVVVTSAISGEGKSTITASLAISCAMGGKKVLLVDGDLRRACQTDNFGFPKDLPGLSDVLIQSCKWQDVLLATKWENLFILPAGKLPPNPAELLSSERLRTMLADLEQRFDLVLIDAPPVNIVSDPLALSDAVAGSLFIVRQDYSDHRDVRKALNAAEMTGMTVLGFAFYGEKVNQSSYYGSYYRRKYYKNYYHNYDNRQKQTATVSNQSKESDPSYGRNQETQADDRTSLDSGDLRHRRSGR